MTDDEAFDDIPSLHFLVDQAADAIRRANHHTYTPREVTDLYPVLGSLHALFSRCDQLTSYLLDTAATAHAADFRHDDNDDVALTLLAIEDDIGTARHHIGQTRDAVDHAWAALGHLALDTHGLICPECGEPAFPGIPTDLTPVQRTAAIRPRHRHGDGTQLCPVMGEHGYQAAFPARSDAADPCTTGTCTDPQ